MSNVSEELVRLQRLLHRIKSEGRPRPEGLEWASAVLLFHLVEQPRRTGELAVCVHSDPSTVSRQAKQLVDLGLVERLPDPEDGRASLLAVTERGRQLNALIRAQRDELLAGAMADWPEQDRDTFVALLGRFNDSLEQLRHRVVDHAPDSPTDSPAPGRTATLQTDGVS